MTGDGEFVRFPVSLLFLIRATNMSCFFVSQIFLENDKPLSLILNSGLLNESWVCFGGILGYWERVIKILFRFLLRCPDLVLR